MEPLAARESFWGQLPTAKQHLIRTQASQGPCPTAWMASSPDAELKCLLQTALDEAPKINDRNSTVHGCPVLRACPGCGALVRHTQEGCPTVWCAECPCSFCFRCLKVGYCGYKLPQCRIKKRQRLHGKGSTQPPL
ncbi:uncharacterized protein ACDP82_000146 [Pangshura tecta]